MFEKGVRTPESLALDEEVKKYYLDGLGFRDIAFKLGKNHQTVTNRIKNMVRAGTLTLHEKDKGTHLDPTKKKRVYEVDHITRQTKELVAVKAATSEEVSKYISMKTDNYTKIINRLIQIALDKKTTPGNVVKAAKELLDRGLGPTSQHGIAVDVGDEGINFTWIEKS